MVELQDELIELIDNKAKEECGVTNLIYASNYIKQLYSYICGEIELSASEIEKKLDSLIGYMTITLDLPCSKLKLLRARKCEETSFSNVSELSCIQNPKENFPKLGRLNKSGTSLFYAAIINSEKDKGLHVVLSEANAYNLDRFNILRSHQKSDTDLILRAIGIWDYIRQNNKPFYMSDNVYNYYLSAYKYISNTFSENLLLAHTLTDKFLADIMCKKGSKRLYQVTSIASSIMLESAHIDGIVYSSVAAKGEPVIALKSTVINSKLEHQYATQVLINEHYGYEFYNYVNEKKANINKKTGQLEWSIIPN